MTHIINIDQLQVKFQNNVILSDISFSLKSGEILGLVGPSGCGKTTLLNTLAGFIEQNHGSIVLSDSLTINKENRIPTEKRNIGMIFQDYALFPHLTVNKNVGFGIKNTPKTAKEAKINELLALLKLDGLGQRFPHQLSGGQQQRVAIARALASQPKILLLDEPFSNIDSRLRNDLMIEIRQLLKSLSISAIFVTHNKDEVFTFADKIAVMYQGKILQFGSPITVSQCPNSWQVADFLQLGSWLPFKNENTVIKTAIGTLQSNENSCIDKEFLLIKPKDIEVNLDTPITQNPKNVVVNHISHTEQGYHYIVKSIDTNTDLSFNRLSFYHSEFFTIDQPLSLTIKPHQLLMF